MNLADEIRAERIRKDEQEEIKQNNYKNASINGIIKAIREDVRCYAQIDPSTNLYKCNKGICLAHENDLLYKLIITKTWKNDQRLFLSRSIKEYQITELGTEIHTEIKKALEKDKITISNFCICINHSAEGPYYGCDIHVKSYNWSGKTYVLPVKIVIPQDGYSNTGIYDGLQKIYRTDDRIFSTELCLTYVYSE